jgi:hypothetical protein
VKTGVAQKELNMTIKRFTAISTLLLVAALGCFGQATLATPVAPAAPVTPAAPLTILTMVGSFYDGGSHHAAMRVGGFIPLSDATSTAKTNWIGLVADMGFGSNSPTTPKYALGGRFLQKVGTIHFGATTSADAYIIGAIGAEIQGSTAAEVFKQAGGLATTVAASAGSNYGYQAATGGGLDIKVNSWLRLHPFAEYAKGSLSGSAISVGLMFSGAFTVQKP